STSRKFARDDYTYLVNTVAFRALGGPIAASHVGILGGPAAGLYSSWAQLGGNSARWISYRCSLGRWSTNLGSVIEDWSLSPMQLARDGEKRAHTEPRREGQLRSSCRNWKAREIGIPVGLVR